VRGRYAVKFRVVGDENQDVQPVVASFGEEMRKEREIRGISLKEIADSTKISKRYLECLERDDYTNLPAAVFTRGFVREYARYLGLNPDEAVNRYLHFRLSLEESGAAPRELKQPPRDIAREPLREMRRETARESLRKIQRGDETEAPRKRGFSLAIWAFLVLVIAVLAALWLLEDRLPWRQIKPTEPVADTNLPVAASVTTPAAPTPLAVNEELVMQVRATEDSWITLESDGRNVFNSQLRRGEQQTFRAREHFRFRSIGNAGGIEISLNGVALPSMGESGRVIRDRVIDRTAIP